MRRVEIAVNRSTPSVTVLARDLVVGEVAYHRHFSDLEQSGARITRHRYGARGFLSESADPRLSQVGQANFTYVNDLAGNPLRTHSVDAGITLALNDAADRPLLLMNNMRPHEEGRDDRSQAVTRTFHYEDGTRAGRPLCITDKTAGNGACVTERFVYGGLTAAEQRLNLAGQCISRYDTAGLVLRSSIALSGAALSITRRLLRDGDNPEIEVDWRGEGPSAWDEDLQPASETYVTRSATDALGTALSIMDAAGNRQRVAYDVAGQLRGSWLTPLGGAEQVIVQSLAFSATGRKLREVHGNGVLTCYRYEPATQHPTGIRSARPAGHAGGAKVLQDLRYTYDPVGNVLSLRNEAEPIRFWRNQAVVAENNYRYDSLYQLADASGREMAGACQQGLGRDVPQYRAFDNATYTRYTRTYTYDVAGNLSRIDHNAPASNSQYSTRIMVSDRSNRAVLGTLADVPSAVEALFSPGGQQTVLLPGQQLAWTPRGELQQVSPVMRDGGPDDRESYRYDSDSQRVLKTSKEQAANSRRTRRVTYLPGLELRLTANHSRVEEDLQVMTVGEAGQAQVRMLHWQAGAPDGVANDQLRYSYDTLLGSSGLEVDGAGNLISQEEYYPFGGTAVWAARSELEACYKTIRYSGKERDATGLYYYGYRYYQPWSGRWLSADPAGTVDGLNLYGMVGNNPVTMRDRDGRITFQEAFEHADWGALDNLIRFPAEFGPDAQGRHVYIGELLNLHVEFDRRVEGFIPLIDSSEEIVEGEGVSAAFSRDIDRGYYHFRPINGEGGRLTSDNLDDYLIPNFQRVISQVAHQGILGDATEVIARMADLDNTGRIFTVPEELSVEDRSSARRSPRYKVVAGADTYLVMGEKLFQLFDSRAEEYLEVFAEVEQSVYLRVLPEGEGLSFYSSEGGPVPGRQKITIDYTGQIPQPSSPTISPRARRGFFSLFNRNTQ